MATFSRAHALGAVAALGVAAPLLTNCTFAADKIDSNDLKALATALALERGGARCVPKSRRK